jgi:hypothetical protein
MTPTRPRHDTTFFEVIDIPPAAAEEALGARFIVREITFDRVVDYRILGRYVDVVGTRRDAARQGSWTFAGRKGHDSSKKAYQAKLKELHDRAASLRNQATLLDEDIAWIHRNLGPIADPKGGQP